MFLIAVFSLIAIGRVVLNLSLWSPYTLFTAPTVFVVYCYLFFCAAPAAMLSSSRAREYARIIAMVLVAIWITSLGVQHVDSARLNTVEIDFPRGRLLTDVTLGGPFADAIQFAAARTQPGDYVLSLPQGPSSISSPIAAIRSERTLSSPVCSHPIERRTRSSALPQDV